MLHLYRLLSCLLLASLLLSCSTRPGIDDGLIDKIPAGSTVPSSYKYDAWNLDASSGHEAISALIVEADLLISEGAYNAATDKLERALRIKPKYAPAWSRLSWLALQGNTPERAIQMAKRSNSYSFSEPKLQLLNWSFIRTASETMHNETMYLRANQMIESLQ